LSAPQSDETKPSKPFSTSHTSSGVPETKLSPNSGEASHSRRRFKLRNLGRILTVLCGEGKKSVAKHAYLDSGAPGDLILDQFVSSIAIRRSTYEMESGTGQPMTTSGTTKFQIRWFDHDRELKMRRVEFDVVENLYPEMIFSEGTIRHFHLWAGGQYLACRICQVFSDI